MDCKKMGFATRQIHAGKHDNGVGALCTPIYQTSTFEFDTVQQGGAALPVRKRATSTPVWATPL